MEDVNRIYWAIRFFWKTSNKTGKGKRQNKAAVAVKWVGDHVDHGQHGSTLDHAAIEYVMLIMQDLLEELEATPDDDNVLDASSLDDTLYIMLAREPPAGQKVKMIDRPVLTDEHVEIVLKYLFSSLKIKDPSELHEQLTEDTINHKRENTEAAVSQAESTTDPLRRSRTLTDAKLTNAIDNEGLFDPKDSATAYVIILSSYTTWSARILILYKPPSESSPGQVDHGRPGRVSPPADVEEKPTDVKDSNDLDDEAAPEPDDAEDEEVDGTANPSIIWSKGSVETRRLLTSSIGAGNFGRVVADEGHHIKHIGADVHRAVRVLDADFKWVLSATPILNRTSDLRGALSLL
ncbi:MAG: hypothetical protein M1833_000355 [Piccolia ochrophora]|nr:MAG: hypothetical protein M1833_000355 [Piccolia ochrophora]